MKGDRVATIKEIAKRARVSAATVSKVLNGKGGASQKTEDTILQLASELNYTPNIYAKNLVSGESRTLGVITEDLTVFNTPEIVDSIDETCEKNGYHYILGNLRINKRFGRDFSYNLAYQKLVDDIINAMLSRQVEGIIYVGCNTNAIPYFSQNCSIPFVCAYCYSDIASITSVIYDDTKAAYDAVALLISQGHRRIGMICGHSGSQASANRRKGYMDALRDNGIAFDEDIVACGDWVWDTGYTLCGKLLAHGVSAIFAHNDVIATGVLDYCNENGVAVGPKLSLIGFDNRQVSRTSRPKLSTVALPLYEIGRTAASVMLDILAGRTPPAQKITVDCHIIERASSCRIP